MALGRRKGGGTRLWEEVITTNVCHLWDALFSSLSLFFLLVALLLIRNRMVEQCGVWFLLLAVKLGSSCDLLGVVL